MHLDVFPCKFLHPPFRTRHRHNFFMTTPQVSAPPVMNYSVTSPVPFNMNGSTNNDMASFMGLMEHEEADFVDQVKKSKAFIQSVIKDKEELAVMVSGHQQKIHKLEGERMEYQKKIIEAERDRRSFQEKLQAEQQSSMQALRQIEGQKREYERLQQDTNTVTKERNDAVGRLGQEMTHLEKLERDKKELLARLDNISKVRYLIINRLNIAEAVLQTAWE